MEKVGGNVMTINHNLQGSEWHGAGTQEGPVATL